MSDVKITDDFISNVAERARFTKADVKDIWDEIIREFEMTVRDSEFDINDPKPETIMKLRSFGSLHIGKIKSRKGSDGSHLPPAIKIYLTLSENIRGAKSAIELEHEEED